MQLDFFFALKRTRENGISDLMMAGLITMSSFHCPLPFIWGYRDKLGLKYSLTVIRKVSGLILLGAYILGQGLQATFGPLLGLQAPRPRCSKWVPGNAVVIITAETIRKSYFSELILTIWFILDRTSLNFSDLSKSSQRWVITVLRKYTRYISRRKPCCHNHVMKRIIIPS